jgi:hypothetical protein
MPWTITHFANVPNSSRALTVGCSIHSNSKTNESDQFHIHFLILFFTIYMGRTAGRPHVNLSLFQVRRTNVPILMYISQNEAKFIKQLSIRPKRKSPTHYTCLSVDCDVGVSNLNLPLSLSTKPTRNTLKRASFTSKHINSRKLYFRVGSYRFYH